MKVIVVNDEQEQVLMEALKNLRVMTQGIQNAKVAYRNVCLQKAYKSQVDFVEKTMAVNDRKMEIVDSLIQSMEEA